MIRLSDVRNLICDCEMKLKQLKNSKSDKSVLLSWKTKMYTLLNDLNQKHKEASGNDKNHIYGLIKEVEDILFIIGTLLDYCEEDALNK